jgi:ribose 5-phosphate isomerase RpiB
MRLMKNDGQLRDHVADGEVLRWQGRVVAAEELRRSLNGHRELVVPPGTILTPLALEELHTRGVRIKRQEAVSRGETSPTAAPPWGYATDQAHPAVHSAIDAVRREGLPLQDLKPSPDAPLCRRAQSIAECIGRNECRGGVFFCQDPGLVCCVANKVAGLRAVAVTTASQAARATLTLGANLVAVEMPGRTFFEIRQILRALCRIPSPACPPGVACTLLELESHAHR